MTCPKICLQALFERQSSMVVLMWKPMGSFSSALGSSMRVKIWNPKPSQVFHFQMHENVRNSIRLLMEAQPYWPQVKVICHHDGLHMNSDLDPICHAPSMWVTLEQIDMHFESIRINGNMNWLMWHPPTLVLWSKPKYGAILLTKLAKNPP